MTTLRTAAQQALEALEEVQKHMNTSDWFDERIDNLRAELAEPVQEPVAYSVGRTLHWHEGKGVNDAQLYLAPPQRKPLSNEEFDRLWRAPMSADWEHREYGRAVEAAHGIKE